MEPATKRSKWRVCIRRVERFSPSGASLKSPAGALLKSPAFLAPYALGNVQNSIPAQAVPADNGACFGGDAAGIVPAPPDWRGPAQYLPCDLNAGRCSAPLLRAVLAACRSRICILAFEVRHGGASAGYDRPDAAGRARPGAGGGGHSAGHKFLVSV